MKKVLKIIGIVLAVIYCIVAITLTVFLLNYNDYNITVLGDKTLIIVRDNDLEPDYRKGDLVVVTKNPNRDIVAGDKIFFYDGTSEKVTVNLGSVIKKVNVTKKETTFTMNGEYSLSSEYVIGKTKTSHTYHNLGGILAFLESRMGFLFLIIFPILVLFIYEIFMVIKEIKSPNEA
ncbi:MAG: hypothetical protein Q4C38_02615 [bacterium]|nr:hypothetical protein [bacterium]